MAEPYHGTLIATTPGDTDNGRPDGGPPFYNWAFVNEA
jgi:hypothetical protein